MGVFVLGLSELVKRERTRLWKGDPEEGRRWLGASLGHVQDPRGHQLPGEPVQALVEAHATAGVTALDVPAPTAAQLVETQELRHFLHGHHPRYVLPRKKNNKKDWFRF